MMAFPVMLAAVYIYIYIYIDNLINKNESIKNALFVLYKRRVKYYLSFLRSF